MVMLCINLIVMSLESLINKRKHAPEGVELFYTSRIPEN